MIQKMDKSTYDIITRIYKNKDYDYFIQKCRITPEFYGDIPRLAKHFCKRTEFYTQGDEPSAEFRFLYDGFSSNDFNVEYNTVLQISKPADLFYIQHEFCIENIDPNRMSPVLDGFDGQAYTRSQYELEEVIGDFLTKHGLRQIYYGELQEVFTELEIPGGIDLFGSQMTVENALFRDLYEICNV